MNNNTCPYVLYSFVELLFWILVLLLYFIVFLYACLSVAWSYGKNHSSLFIYNTHYPIILSLWKVDRRTLYVDMLLYITVSVLLRIIMWTINLLWPCCKKCNHKSIRKPDVKNFIMSFNNKFLFIKLKTHYPEWVYFVILYYYFIIYMFSSKCEKLLFLFCWIVNMHKCHCICIKILNIIMPVNKINC